MGGQEEGSFKMTALGLILCTGFDKPLNLQRFLLSPADAPNLGAKRASEHGQQGGNSFMPRPDIRPESIKTQR
jgi:hypothetical protein